MSLPIRILVVDDTALYRKIVGDVLRSLPGVEVVGTAFNGQVALEKIQELRPDLVTLDLEMPQMGGVEVLRRLRSDERTKLLPVVILTSSVEQQDRLRGYDLGANSYVRKPVDFNQFIEAVRQLGLYWLILNERPPTPGD